MPLFHHGPPAPADTSSAIRLERLKVEFASKYPQFSSNLEKYEENCSLRYIARAEAEATGVGKKNLSKKYPLPPEMNELILVQLAYTDNPNEH